MLGSDLDSLFSLEQVYLTSLSFSFLLYTAGRIKSDGAENKTQSNKNLRTGHSASKLSDYHPDHSYSECYTASNTALSNYYCLFLSTKVLYFVDITIFCNQLQLSLHLIPSFLWQSPVWRGYSHQKENMDDALHSPVPKIPQQCAWQRNLGPRVDPPPGNFWPLPFTIFHHCPECQPSGQFQAFWVDTVQPPSKMRLRALASAWLLLSDGSSVPQAQGQPPLSGPPSSHAILLNYPLVTTNGCSFLWSPQRTSASLGVPSLASLLTPQSMCLSSIPPLSTNPENVPWICFHSDTHNSTDHPLWP